MGPVAPYLIGGAIAALGAVFIRHIWPLVLLASAIWGLIYLSGSGINAATSAVGLGNVFTFDSDVRREVARQSSLRTGFYVDRDTDYAHVVGTFTNNSTHRITHAWIECRVEMTDISGVEVINLVGNVGPWRSVIEPGETVKFDVASMAVTGDARLGGGQCQMAFRVIDR